MTAHPSDIEWSDTPVYTQGSNGYSEYRTDGLSATITDGRHDASGNYRGQMIEWFEDLGFNTTKILVDTVQVSPPGKGHGNQKWTVTWDQVILDDTGVARRDIYGNLFRRRASHSNTYPPPWYREDGNW